MRPPWEREWINVTPEQFEEMVVAYLEKIGQGQELKGLSVQHQTPVSSPDGEFAMDAVATFDAFGAEFRVLVECKHHKNPIKRELVQVLADKLRSVHAQKAMMFSTTTFQRGAIEYARAQRIALVHFTEGGPIYETRARDSQPGPKRPYDAYFVTLSDGGGMSYRFGSFDDVNRLLFEMRATP